MLNQKHVARRFRYKLYNVPYTVNVAIFVHHVNVCHESFVEQKLLIILQQSGILCTELVTRNILVKCPKTPIFLPPVNDKKNLKCVCVCVCNMFISFYCYLYFLFLLKKILTLRPHNLKLRILNFIFTNPSLNHCCIRHNFICYLPEMQDKNVI
jgi:hypothetical protein